MDEHAFPPTGFAVARLGCSLHVYKSEYESEYFTGDTPNDNVAQAKRTWIHVIHLGSQKGRFVFSNREND